MPKICKFWINQTLYGLISLIIFLNLFILFFMNAKVFFLCVLCSLLLGQFHKFLRKDFFINPLAELSLFFHFSSLSFIKLWQLRILNNGLVPDNGLVAGMKYMHSCKHTNLVNQGICLGMFCINAYV